ncbi:MAG: hypothetical protein DRJ60_02305 [Thermoprotei archaeon]|nr:MAG: hypothetical protein DRJ60_02305 [Thermoprotei archaeon]
MPETELKDLGEKLGTTGPVELEKSSKKYYHTLPIGVKQLEELADYDVGDEVRIELACKVRSISEDENHREVTLEIRKGRVLNLKPEREKALRMGIKKETLDKIRK